MLSRLLRPAGATAWLIVAAAIAAVIVAMGNWRLAGSVRDLAVLMAEPALAKMMESAFERHGRVRRSAGCAKCGYRVTQGVRCCGEHHERAESGAGRS